MFLTPSLDILHDVCDIGKDMGRKYMKGVSSMARLKVLRLAFVLTMIGFTALAFALDESAMDQAVGSDVVSSKPGEVFLLLYPLTMA